MPALGDALSGPLPIDEFLLESNGLPVAVGDDVRVQRSLLAIQLAQCGTRGRALVTPVELVSEERLSIHEHRCDVRQTRSHSVEDAEAVSVQVAPVVDLHVVQPGQ